MARPFAHTFEKDQSPLSPQAGSPSTPISYKTNVNRQKTKKWAEAKPIDYGGDDWGDDDEYEAQPPPPVSKPTGLRQAGQGIGAGSGTESPVSDVSKKAYGDLPPLPGASNTVRPRANSFDPEDEQRNFSNSMVRQPSPPISQVPPTRFSHITGESSRRNPSGQPPLSISTNPGTTAMQNASQVVSPPSDTSSPHPDILLPGRRKAAGDGSSTVVSPLSETRSPSGDFQARRDFSPSAVPQPLATRTSVASQSAGVESQGALFPARKSSLSQATGPEVSEFAPEMAPMKPWAGGRSSSPGAASRTPMSATSPPKVLPFIRPADIYRRMEEEREKERQSMESGRPSMDSTTRGGASERSGSPAKSFTRETTDIGGSGRRRSSFEADDVSESGRRLMPMLEPVKERKSEYGFDGFNVNDPALPGKFEDEPKNTVQDKPGLDLDQDSRPKSVSPKLPDLYRMSGFGLDMFSPTKTESAASRDPPATEKSPVTASTLTPIHNDPSLRKEPSLGFTSVVHQAFDRPSDSSIPATPASNTGSAVKRSDSESTGTTGISPIMSRVPSSAVAEGRNRDIATPAILEAVHEPESPPLVEDRGKSPQDVTIRHADPFPLPFKPGHRRDISTPSPGNSPARSPDVGNVAEFPIAEKATIASGAAAALVDDEPLQPPRPITEREHSFRPALPGGWTSYATSARSATPQNEAAQGTVDHDQIIRTDMPPPARPRGTDDQELTPTAIAHPSPHSGRDAAAIAALGGAAGLALAKHENEKKIADPDFVNPRAISGNSALPTPDPAMAPSGNVYSATKLDPRLTSLPPLEHAPAETQLRPDVVNRDISADSSAAPTPPPKDTPRAASDGSSEYFPRPTVPLKPRSQGQAPANEYIQSLSRPPMLPTLSTDTKPHDEENDKLRKEIVKSLSPRPSDVSSSEHFLTPGEAAGEEPSRESTYLPSEYDNYWASTADEEPSEKRASKDSKSKVPIVAATTAAAGLGLKAAESAAHHSGTSREAEPPPEAARPLLSNRFSWEASSITGTDPSFDLAPSFPVPESHQAFSHSATANIEPSKDSGPSFPVPESQQAFSHSSTANIEPSSDNGPGFHVPESHQAFSHSSTANIEASSDSGPGFHVPESHQAFSHSSTANIEPSGEHLILSEPVMASEGSNLSKSTLDRMQSEPDTSKEDHAARDAALGAGAAVVAGVAYATQPQPQSQDVPQRRLSLAEEKAGGPGVSAYPVSPTPPLDEHPARSEQPYLPSNTEYSSASPVSPVSTSIKPVTSPSVKIPSFKEIMILRTPQERIQAFEETRQRFATMDSGLGDWITRLQSQHVEHAGLAGSWHGSRTSAPSGSARSKFSKGTSFGPQQSQQPYFQQYLNASSPGGPSSPSSTQAGSSFTPTGTQQGLSPAGGKMTSQQVQAKGKEFLHTAGMFGGKAGKAGKGLLAKGKNKLRGSGAGDKTPTNTTPQSTPSSKTERRSSWGFPLSMTRSSSRPDASPRNASKESTPVPGHQRSATFTSSTGSPQASIHRPTASTSSIGLGVMGGAAALFATQNKETTTPPQPDASSSIYTPAHTLTPSPNNEAENALEAKDTLTPPMPISKNQPSWDPFNATPIFEEEAFLYEERNPARVSAGGEHPGAVGRHDGLLDVPRGDVSRSARSSEETQQTPFYDAPEDPLESVASEADGDVDEWVMVDEQKRPEVDLGSAVSGHRGMKMQDVDDTERPTVPLKEDSADTPTRLPSILARPRGSLEVPGILPVHSPRTSQSPRTSPSQPAAAQFQHNSQPVSSMAHVAPGQSATETSADKPLLPPIRRGTTFGIPFDSEDTAYDSMHRTDGIAAQHSRTEKPLPELTERLGEQRLSHHEGEIAAVAGAAAVGGIMNRNREDRLPRIPAAEPREDPEPQQYRSKAQNVGHLRPPLMPNGSSEYSQASQQGMLSPQQGAGINIPGAADIQPLNGGYRRSQDAWRPNAVSGSAYTAGNDYVNVPRYSFEQSQRPSLEQSRPRGHSTSSSTGQRLSGYIPRPDLPSPAKPFEQPPSSAQRYPGLFQSVPAPDMPHDNVDLPDHYYQAALPRDEVFLPRQQPNEYQLPGIGPPIDEPRSASRRRSSGFFRELGGRISRGASRERRSMSRNGEVESPTRQPDPRGYPEANDGADDAQERSKRRSSSLLGAFRRSSTAGAGPPQSRESTIAHHAGSRTDLLLSGEPSPVKKEERKRSFFGSTSGKANKLSRASTSNVDDSGKRRFSGLSGFFGKAGQRKSRDSLPEQRVQATRELSYNERQPLESPRFEQGPAAPTETRQYHPVPDEQPSQDTTQPRNVLTKPTKASNANGAARQESRSRRPSASGLFGGIIGRRSQKQHRDRSESQSRSSATQQPVHQVPPAQTYTDLQEQQAREYGMTDNVGAIPWQEAENQPPERGRRVSRPPQEPTYDSVPIPGGYSLVRAQGATAVPTDYDPRGIAHLAAPSSQSYPHPNPNSTNGYKSPQSQQYSARTNRHSPQNNPTTTQFGAVGAMHRQEPYRLPAVPRNLEYDEDAGRSPDSQQRPYQLALPGEEPSDHEDDHEPPLRAPTQGNMHGQVPQQQQARQRPHHPIIHRLQTQNQSPIPQNAYSPPMPSPSDFPLPPSSTSTHSLYPTSPSPSSFLRSTSTPRYESAPPAPFPPSPSYDVGPVPPPKSESRMRSMERMRGQGLGQNQNLGVDRSSTHRTTISDVSQMSNENIQPNATETTQQEQLQPPPHPFLVTSREIDPSNSTAPNSAANSAPSTPPRPAAASSVETGKGNAAVNRAPSLPLRAMNRQFENGSTTGGSGGNGGIGGGLSIRETLVERAGSPDLYDATPRGVKRFSGPKISPAPRKGGGSGGGMFLATSSPSKGGGEGGEGLEGKAGDADHASMSATSYPGQEWNPYAGGHGEGWEE